MSARKVAVAMPWRPTPDRLAAHDRCVKYWCDNGLQVFEADSNPAFPFLCNESRNHAVRAANTHIVVIADADTIPDDFAQIERAVHMVGDNEADLVYPFTEFWHIDTLWATGDYTRAPAQRVYHNSPGGIFVIATQTLWAMGGFDEHFTPGASQFDDTAFALAVTTLGTIRRVPGRVYSFNHATKPDGAPDRDWTATNPNFPRFQRYQQAFRRPDLMRKLIGATNDSDCGTPRSA